MKLNLVLLLVIPAVVLLICSINPGLARAATGEKWWERSYEGEILPSQARPPWKLVEPQAKSGMVIEDKISGDGSLLMTIKGTGASHYYLCSWEGSGRAWTGSSELGSTVEFKIRVTEDVPDIPYTCLFSFDGFGPEKKHAAVIYVGKKTFLFLVKTFP